MKIHYISLFFVPLHRYALVAELVDAPDLGSGCSRSAGSSPVRRTIKNPNCLNMSS